MNIRPAFSNFIQSQTGIAKPSIGTVESPGQSDAEQNLPGLAKGMADYFGTVRTNMPESEVEKYKKPMAAMIEAHPEAQETFAQIADKACPEGLPIAYTAGPEEGIFQVQINEFNLFHAQPELYGPKMGTLFVDTTPSADGIQYFFHSDKK